MLSELGGFAVLSAGPLALLIVFVIGVVAVWIAARRGKSPGKRWAIGILAAVVVILIPTWDEIAGRAYFRHLCESKSGIEILQQVTLGPEYKDVQLADAPWLYKNTRLASLYPYRLESTEDLPGPARIRYVRQMIRDQKTGATLGTVTNYFYGGGWFQNAVSLQGSGGGSCDLGANYFKTFLEQVFVVPR